MRRFLAVCFDFHVRSSGADGQSYRKVPFWDRTDYLHLVSAHRGVYVLAACRLPRGRQACHLTS